MQVGFLYRDKEFIFTNLDLGALNMEKYIWLDTNITAFQLVDTSSPEIKFLVREWMLEEFKGFKSPLENEKTFRVESNVPYNYYY